MNNAGELPNTHASKLFFFVRKMVPPESIFVPGEEALDAI